MTMFFHHESRSGPLGVVAVLLMLLLLAPRVFCTTLDTAEYFWDTDPGVGNGTALTVVPSDTAYEIMSVPTGSLSLGPHVLFVRYLDSQGRWSEAEARQVYISPPLGATTRTITNAEYFWDSDPGEGNGTAVAFSPAASVHFARNTSAPAPAGDHVMKVRYQDNSGLWSRAEGRRVRISPPLPESPPTIVQARVYFDSLTSTESGTYLVPDDGVYDEPQEETNRLVSAALFTAGEHLVFSRVQDSRGFWSPATLDTFLVGAFDFGLVVRPTAAADSVRLSWNAYPVTDNYEVHVDSLLSGPFTTFVTVPGSDTTVTLPTVSPPPVNPKRFYQVNAVLLDTTMFRGDPLPPEYSRAQ